MLAGRLARHPALVVTLLSALGFVVVAAIWVPWQPVPGGAPVAVRPESVFSADEIERAEDYASWARGWSLLSLAISLVVSSVLGFSRVGRRLMKRLPGPWWIKVVLGVLAISLVGRLATLACSIMLHRHRLANGLSNQSWWGYARDVATNELITVVTTSIGLLLLIGAARRWPRVWPAIAAAVLAGLVVLGSFIYPLVVEPLFNSFTPMPDGELRSAVIDLAEREGVRVDDVLVADASRRTTTLNAYVSGFGDTRRVVVYDTLVESLPHDQALSVIAHEVAHTANDDVVVGTALGALGAAAGVGLLGLLLSGRAGRRHPVSDPGAVPLVLALVVLATLATSPLQNAISRRVETRADVVALEATRDADAFVEMQRALALRSLADPTPPAWMHWWWGSHPVTLERIALARHMGARE
ncbi:M48 family metallopeptidase [Nocardioides piscis]|uniref:M48 family metallopeptidase n=1 Tax=Nocardioides piscis TaxID=2714938 RepID=A0A6G7YJH7_9ACTN|nr:M48 family metallopeptidase [Nocardioides piscis]QIK76892.1 M48 family metallopeptidase [Nocardioides piscis]